MSVPVSGSRADHANLDRKRLFLVSSFLDHGNKLLHQPGEGPVTGSGSIRRYVRDTPAERPGEADGHTRATAASGGWPGVLHVFD